MKRHFTGFAVFALVVVCFALSSAIIPRIVLVPDDAVTVENEVKSTGMRPDSVTSQLASISYDETSKRFLAVVRLQWNRSFQPPDLVNLNIGLSTAEKPGETDVIHYMTLRKPFAHGSAISQQIEWDDLFWGTHNLSKKRANQNFYAHAAVSVPDEESETTKLVVYEYNYLRGSVPLVIKHRNK